MPNQFRFLDILKVLCRHEVDFIVVGGVAAILEGAPVSTFDLDIVHLRDDENHDRLLSALEELNSRYRDPAGRYIVPDLNKIQTFRLHRLITDNGPLDLLTDIDPDLGFESLIEQTVLYEIAEVQVRVLRLEAVIESKVQSDRAKDRAVLPVLKRTLELKRRKD